MKSKSNDTIRSTLRILVSVVAACTIIKITNITSSTTEQFERRLKNAAKRTTKIVPSRSDTFKKVAKSVVFIDTMARKAPQQGDDERKNKKNKNLKRKTLMEKFTMATTPLGSGTGWLYDNEGHIVTNNHVVAGGDLIEVSVLTKKDTSVQNSKLYPTSLLGYDPSIDASIEENYHWRVCKADVVGTDPDNDIAVIKCNGLNAADIHAIDIGDDTKMDVGDNVLAIGNPFGLDHTLTTGIISAKGRVSHSESGRPMTNLIQTDAAINPGNSGGPLLNEFGEIIGMNSMIMSKSGSSSGIGFAIPITRIQYIANHLIKHGVIVRPVIGMSFAESLQAYLGVKEGVLIGEVHEHGPAAKAGLSETTIDELDGSVNLGDVITKVDGVKVLNELHLYDLIASKNPGEDINLTYVHTNVMGRKKVIKQAVLTLGSSAN